jgi:threonine-phosphate decarboxylase
MMECTPMHGGQLRKISERFNIPASRLIDFSANINPEGPPPAVLQMLRQCLEDRSTLTSYPDLEEDELKRAVTMYVGVTPQTVAVSNGFVPLLQAALQSLNIKRCLLPVPGFVEYRRILTQMKIRISPHILAPGSSFSYDFDRMLSGNQGAILLANPQNPSGVFTAKASMIEFVSAAAAKNIFILLDEAFIDYIPGESLVDQVEHFSNLIVFRSVTKFFAIPGLRVAYAVAGDSTTRLLNAHLAPWPISTLASRAAGAAFGDHHFADLTRTLNAKRRGDLRAGLEALGVHVYPSAANFLLLRLPGNVQSSSFCQRAILEHHLVLRDCSNYEALSPDHVRAAVRTDRENALLVESVGKILDLVTLRSSTMPPAHQT